MRLLVLVFLVMLAQVGITQDTHHTMRHYTAVDGLPQSQVNAVVEDDNGYLWIGTEGGGLARFDGREFKIFTTLDGLLTNFVVDIKIDSKHNLWMHHPRGITRYDGLSFKRFLLPGEAGGMKHLVKVFEVQDTIFALSREGHVSKLHGDSVYYWDKPIIDNVRLLTVHQAANDAILVYLETAEILVYTEGRLTRIQTPFKPGQYIRMFNRGDELRIRTIEGDVYTFDILTQQFHKSNERLEHAYILMYDKKDNVYWSFHQGNLFRGIPDGHHSVDTVVRDVDVNRIFIDSENNTWIATNGAGLFKYYLQDFERCTSENLRGVMAIHVDREGASWIGTMSKGLWKIKKGKITSYEQQDIAYRNNIHCIKESPDGTLWVGTAYGLGKYNADSDSFTWLTTKEGLSFNNVIAIDFDEKGNLWIGTANGLNYYDGKTFKHYTMHDGLKSNLISALVYSKAHKTAYVGSELGINTVSDGRVGLIAIPELENAMVLSLHTFRDSLLLIGSGGSGAMVFNPISHEKKSITTREGLTSDFIYFIAHDKEDKIWIGMEKGISRLMLSDRLEIMENLHFDYDNGLIGVETNQNAYFLGENKYFGLIDGLYEYNELNKEDKRSFDLHLTDVELLYGEYSAHEYSDSLMGFFKIPYNPMLPHDRSHITFHFNRVDKQYPKSVKFKYFLQNFDLAWSQPSSATQVTYSNLPPGDYVFRVMATNNEGSWAETKIAYPFTVKAPFYQTASFIAGVIIFVAGSITLLMYLRVRQRVKKMIDTERIRVRELENLRKEIARDFHDEMGNQLTRIINYVSLMKLNGNGHNPHADLYAKVEHSAKVLYTGTRDFIWSIDPVNDELSKLFVHIRDFGDKLFEEKNIQFRAFDHIKEKVKLPNGFSREANLIFKEAMTNAFKYSKAENVSLILRAADEHIEMKLEDDGVGFDTADVEKMNGLKNIRDRAEKIGAALRISSERGSGTTVALQFKLTKITQHGITI